MSTEEILKKHPPIKDIEREEAKIEEAKSKYAVDQAEIEKAFTEYSQMLDPMFFNGKPIAYVRRPSMKQLKALIPPEMRKYVGKPSEIPEDVAEKNEKFFYQKMSELIATPEYTAEEWEEKANPWFIRLFWQHIANIAQLMEGQIEGF